MKKLTIDGLPVEVGDSEAGIIETLISQRDAARNAQPSITLKVGDVSKTVTGNDALVTEITGRDAKIKELEGKILSPEALDKLVQTRATERTAVVGDALKLVPDFEVKEKSNIDICREVVTAVIAGDASAKSLVEAVLSGKTVGDASSEQIAIAFKALASQAASTHANGADTAISLALISGTQAKPVAAAGDATKPTGRSAFVNRSHNAWRGQQAQQ